jgi:hypothetical protein
VRGLGEQGPGGTWWNVATPALAATRTAKPGAAGARVDGPRPAKTGRPLPAGGPILAAPYSQVTTDIPRPADRQGARTVTTVGKMVTTVSCYGGPAKRRRHRARRGSGPVAGDCGRHRPGVDLGLLG